VESTLSHLKMDQEALNKEFEKAVERVNNYPELFPADFLLRLYAYYKKATHNIDPPGSRRAIINAFKANALFQAKGISESEAKEKYVELVKEFFAEKK